MCNSGKESIEIIPRFQYNQDFDRKQNSREKALMVALETRKFEIDLYWRRTAYFWAFIVSIYAAYYFVLTAKISFADAAFRNIALIGLSFLGYFFSLAWWMVNKGSKFWQENWEKHVCWLEKPIQGPLYGTYLNPKSGSRWHPLKMYDFSVSRVNLLASFVVGLFSLVFFIFNAHHFFFSLVSAKCCLLDISFFVLVLLASYCIVKMCEGHQAERDEVEPAKKDFIRPKN